jgi:CheY-like chemotaxis protein
VVEDDENVRMTVVEMLSDLGYQVLKARDAQSAFAIVESGMDIDLLFTDVVMPGPMRSIDLARKTRERLPNVAVLFTSGYTDNAIVHGGRLDDNIDLLSKPYTREALAWKVRHVLQSQSRLANVPPPPQATREIGTNFMPDQPQNLKILLVEDDVLIRMNTADMLTGLGHAVMEAHTADDALKILHEQAVEVLLTDVSLPGISGVELALLSLRKLPGLRIIFATGHESVPAMNDYEELAGAIVLPKPYNEKQLADALSTDK